MNILLVIAALYIAYKWGGQQAVQQIEDTNLQNTALKNDGKTPSTVSVDANAHTPGDVTPNRSTP